MTLLALVRHGETDWNQEKRMQGQRDIPLNESGKRQAAALADRLATERWDLVYSSDLSRALHTAQTIGKRLHIPVYADSRLREIGFGRLEGTTVEDRIMLYGESWNEMDHGIEQQEAIWARSTSFLQDVLKRHGGLRIIAVSHGAFIADTLRELMGDPSISHLGNTSVTVLKHREQSWQCELLNCTRHLV
jgi:2,3-bisphosphoglycerate-dependent phosphoglycerate mutase